MKFLIKDIDKNEKERLEKMGLYCYDLRESDLGDEIANIERNVFVNKVGNMVTNEKIEFNKSPNDFVNYFDFCMKNEQVDRIEDLFVENKLDISEILKETNADKQPNIMSKLRKINDTFYIVDLGYRKDQPVALVEKRFGNGSKEYIIAFDYNIENDKISWGYGYYYNENIEQAKEDFTKVLNGDNLADIFSEKETEENKFNPSFYSEEEIKDLIKSNAELYYVDDGVDETIIKFEDIPDFIVEYNRKFDTRDLKFFKVGKSDLEADITTYGEYLNTIKPELRERLIDRLVALQTNEAMPKKFKIINEDIYNYVESKIEQEQKMKKGKNKEAR